MHGDEHTPAGRPAGGSGWSSVGSVDTETFNSDLVDGEPTVDIAVHYPDNLHPVHRRKAPLDAVLDGLLEARRIFGPAGVQLALVSVRTGRLDPALLAVPADEPGSELPPSRYANLYEERQVRPARLSAAARAAFETVIPNHPGADRRIHIVVLQDVFMSFHEQLDERTWQLKTIATGAMSFPGYSHGAGIPRRLRGVITITDLSRPTSWKTIAHELGHKLINASHEYRNIDPQHEVYADGGLLLYGDGIDIPAGPAGRFHLERLHRSPFLYRKDRAGTKVWNSDYHRDGGYYDPIYEGLTVPVTPGG